MCLFPPLVTDREEVFVVDKKRAYRQVLWVFLALVVLTIIEFIVSQVFPSAAVLMIAAFMKAGLIVYYFMHVYRLWREESH